MHAWYPGTRVRYPGIYVSEIHLIVKHVDSVCWVYERVRVSDLHCDYLFIYQFGIHLSTMS